MGENYFLEYGGDPVRTRPIIEEQVEGEKVELSISARDEKEMRKILEGLKRKYPNIDVEESMKTAEHKKEYFNEPLQFNLEIGGKEVFKSITKTAINFYIFKGGDRNSISHLLDYLNGKTQENVVWMHYPNDEIYTPDEEEVSHVMKLVGNPKEKLLYCYIELFNTHNFIVKLNEDYEGEFINETYVFDLIESKELSKNIELNYNREKLLDIFENKDPKPFDKVRKRISRVVSIAMKRQSSNYNKKIINEAIKNSLGKYPEGTPITQDMINELINEIMEEVTPMILRTVKRNEGLDDEKGSG